MNGYLATWKKAFTFAGRASRSEYWMFYLFTMIAVFALGILTAVLIPAIGGKDTGSMMGAIGSGIVGLFMVATFFPFLAVMVRRLHDTGRSGWWFWIAIVPLIGGVWLFVLTVLDSQSGTNEYGAHPYGAEGGAGRIQTV
jgi:uncharacterized membrane protein YhaH (DUF805 family)